MSFSRTVLVLNLSLFLLVAAFLLLCPRVLGHLLMEDTPVEWAGFLFLSGACVYFSRATGQRFDRRTVLGAFWCAGLAMLSFFVAGEEVSWGQRILSFETPAFFRTHNVQEEVTVHNLGFVWLHPKGFAVLFMVAYGVLLPVSVACSAPLGRITSKYAIPVPPPGSIAGFLLAAWLMTKPITGTDDEVGELLFSVSLLGSGMAAAKPGPSGARMSRVVIVMFLVACLLSLASFRNSEQRMHLIRIGPLKSGQILEGLGRSNDAAREYEKLARFWKTDWDLWIRVIDLYRQGGNIGHAYDLASWFLRVHRREWRAYDLLIYCGLLLDIPDDVACQLHEIMVEEPENPHVQRAIHELRLRAPEYTGDATWDPACIFR